MEKKLFRLIVLLAFLSITFLILASTTIESKPSKEVRKPAPVKVVKKVEPTVKKKKLVIAVIDTGFGFKDVGSEDHLCDTGHKDFTGVNIFYPFNTKDPVPADRHSHGTNVAGLIEKHAGDSDYCMIIIKFYDTEQPTDEVAIKATLYAVSLKPDIINYSMGGDEYLRDEAIALRKYLDEGGTVIAAAGNNNEKLDLNGTFYYPAMNDDRIIVVGSLDNNGVDKAKTSNYGDLVKYWEVGQNQSAYGIWHSGTSQATAIKTGKVIYNISHKGN